MKQLCKNVLSGINAGMLLDEHSDERIAATRQIYKARVGAVLTTALGVDVLVRCYILRQDSSLWWDIGLMWYTSIMYFGIGITRNGVPGCGAIGKWTWKPVGIMIVTLTLMMLAAAAYLGMVHSVTGYIAYTAFGLAGSIAALAGLRSHYKNWEHRTLGSNSSEEER